MNEPRTSAPSNLPEGHAHRTAASCDLDLFLGLHLLLLMIEILPYLKDPKLWELWYIPFYG